MKAVAIVVAMLLGAAVGGGLGTAWGLIGLIVAIPACLLIGIGAMSVTEWTR